MSGPFADKVGRCKNHRKCQVERAILCQVHLSKNAKHVLLPGLLNQQAYTYTGNPLRTPRPQRRKISVPPRPSTLEGVRSASGIRPPASSGCTSLNERGPPAEFVHRRDCSLSPLSSSFTPQMNEVRQQALVPVPSVVTVTPKRSEAC